VVVGQMQQTIAALDKAGVELAGLKESLSMGVAAVAEAGTYIATNYATDVRAVAVGAVPFLKLMGIVTGGWMMARAALVARERIAAGDGDPFYVNKVATAVFYGAHVLPAAPGLSRAIIGGGASALAIADDQL
jgi:3-(methylthio)propanoyl-CoA dehydrogenase